MSIERYRATVALTYPALNSLKDVLAAGGLSKLTPEQRQSVTMKHVKAGALADGLPEKSIKRLLRDGKIEKVGAKSTKRKGKK
jgi:hypothetical protein